MMMLPPPYIHECVSVSARFTSVNHCDYCEMEASGSNNCSATKEKIKRALSAHRADVFGV